MKTYYTKTVFESLNLENTLEFIKYLKNLGGKELSISCRRQNAFKTKWYQREEKLRARCHIQNAVEYLEVIKNEFSIDQIKIVIADIANYINVMDKNEDLDFILLSSNILPSAIHFKNSRSLFYFHKIPEGNNNYDTDLITLYAIRLSLESRIKGLLGIDFITENGKPISLGKMINISKQLKSVKFNKNFSWNEVQWVNEWLNHHMHRLLRPYPWIIHQAIEILQPLLLPLKPVITENAKKFSFYSASIIENNVDFKKEVTLAFETTNSNVKIQWKLQREIMLNTTN